MNSCVQTGFTWRSHRKENLSAASSLSQHLRSVKQHGFGNKGCKQMQFRLSCLATRYAWRIKKRKGKRKEAAFDEMDTLPTAGWKFSGLGLRDSQLHRKDFTYQKICGTKNLRRRVERVKSKLSIKVCKKPPNLQLALEHFIEILAWFFMYALQYIM